MNEYKVTQAAAINWAEHEAAELTQCLWSPNVAPKVTAQAMILEGKALLFRLESREKPTRCVNTEPDTPVCQDSCLESFFSFDGMNYVNLECNSNGALYAAFGKERHGRRFLREMEGLRLPTAEARATEEGWEAVFTVPFETIKMLWGNEALSKGEFYANFYSCGDLTPLPHYNAWNRVETEKPDFHRPEYFGKLVIAG